MPNAPKFAIGVEPKEAIEFLRQKKILASKVFTKALHDSALARATTIARLTSLDMTKDIYQSLENAMREGKGFHAWKKELVNEFERKGWIFGKEPNIRGVDGNLLADPKTGEYFGTPRRLNTIYRVNMQSAYSAARYQRLMDNVDNRPYWQYSAVGDARTRPAHLALNGKVYRYDDPFWATFYPPNGFNCRCTVIALAERDLKRRGMDKPDDSSEFLVDVERPADKQGKREKTVGFKLSDGTVRVTDKGFDYNVGASHLAYLGKLMLQKGETLPPRLSAIAINETFKNAELMTAFKSDFKNTVRNIGQELDNKKAESKNILFNVGAILPEVITILEQEGIVLKSSIISINDEVIYHAYRDNKAQRKGKDKRLPMEFWESLPEMLLNPKAVLRDKTSRNEKIRTSTILYIFEVPTGKVAIRFNYKDNGVNTNSIRSGEKIVDMTTFTDKNKFDLLYGSIK